MVTKCLLHLVLLTSFAFLISFEVHSQPTDLQRFSITPMPAPSEGVAVFRDHPEKAGIIIESPITNLAFSSNMDGIVDQRSEPGRGRYVLIIESFTQIIVVDAPGYIQGRFRVGNPAARDVLYYEIEPEEQQQNLISVIFNVDPQGATLYVDDQLTETNRTVQLPPGSNPVRIEHEGYRIIEDVVTVSAENIYFTYELEQVDIVPVRISANVPGAMVLIDGVEQGTIDNSGNFGYFLYPGQYALSLQRSGYLSENVTIEVEEIGENRFDFRLEPNIGVLELDVTPSDAQIQINRQDHSGQRRVELAPGRYRLEIEKQGYESHSELFEVTLTQTLSREISLSAYTGSLQFNIIPGNAHVRLQDSAGETVESWEGVNLLHNLKAGRYKLEASAPDYSVQTTDIVIRRDETSRVRIELQPHAVTQMTQPIVQAEPSDSERRMIWLVSAEGLMLTSDSFKKNYSPSFMTGLSVAGLWPFAETWYGRFGIGVMFTTTAAENPVDSSGGLWYPFGQSAVGLKLGVLRVETQLSVGVFMLKDMQANEILRHSFFHAGVGAGFVLPFGIEAMLNYALYSEPKQNPMMGLRLSFRL